MPKPDNANGLGLLNTNTDERFMAPETEYEPTGAVALVIGAVAIIIVFAAIGVWTVFFH